MDLIVDNILEKLLLDACPSIQLRIRKEILEQSSEDEEVDKLQGLILRDKLVQQVLYWMGPDGWASSTFHGTNGIETGVRILQEKGVSERHPAMQKALEVLKKEPRVIYRGIGRPGKVLDDLAFGGSQMIRSVVFVYAGEESDPCVEEQIKVALKGLDFIGSVDDIEDVTEGYKNKRVFKPGVEWPSIYHLRLLAFSQKWRTPENYHRVIVAVKKLVELSPIPYIHVLDGSQLIAPASFAMQDFNPDVEKMDDAAWLRWFLRMDLFSRLGVVGLIPELHEQVGRLDGILEDGNGWFNKELSHSHFSNWGAYTGLRLENDWRSPKRRLYDLTFRSLLIKRR